MPATPPIPELVQNPVFDVAKLRELTKDGAEIVKYSILPPTQIYVIEVNDYYSSYSAAFVEIAPTVETLFPIVITFYTATHGPIIQYSVEASGDSTPQYFSANDVQSVKFISITIDALFKKLSTVFSRTEIEGEQP